MERWQQQLQEILNAKKVVEGLVELIPDSPAERCPSFTFVVGPGAAIGITSIKIGILRPGLLPRELEQGVGTCLLMDARCLPADAQCIAEGGGRIEEGIWIESCEPYVMRAIDRCCALWYVPSGACGILAVLPCTMLDLYDLLVYEYAHRYCPARNMNQSQLPWSSGKEAFPLGRSSSTVKHVCGALVLRQRFYGGRLHCRGAGFALQIKDCSLVFRTLSGLPITHCPACGTELNATNTCSLDWAGWSADL